MINALANHGLLPHDGRAITKQTAVEALTSGIHLDASIASIFTSGALATNPDHTAHTFDLHTVGVHGAIEHDVSLSREDVAFGSNSDFSKDIFAVVLRDYSNQGDPEEEGETESSATTGKKTTTTTSTTNWRSATRVRYARVMASKAKHEQHDKTWTYGLREAVMSYGETALLLSLLGKDGVAPIEWIRILFGESHLVLNWFGFLCFALRPLSSNPPVSIGGDAE